jgi:hypothetical protein
MMTKKSPMTENVGGERRKSVGAQSVRRKRLY